MLYESNLSKFNTGQWLFTDQRVCMNNWSYAYTWYASDIFANSYSTWRTYGVSLPSYSIWASAFSLWTVGVTGVQQVLSWPSTSEFWVQDNQWSWWYTTIQLPLALTWVTNTNIAIGQSSIKLKWTWITTLQWTSTSTVYVNSALSSYSTFNWARNYIIKDYTNNNYSCPTGKYGNIPSMSVDIPARQSPDTYSGIITFDINN